MADVTISTDHMYAEGSQFESVTEAEITDILNDEGFDVDNMEIWFDEDPQMYHWYCQIEKF